MWLPIKSLTWFFYLGLSIQVYYREKVYGYSTVSREARDTAGDVRDGEHGESISLRSQLGDLPALGASPTVFGAQPSLKRIWRILSVTEHFRRKEIQYV